MHNRLIIDTSSEYCFLGIGAGTTLLASRIELHANQLSRILLPLVEALLKDTSLTLREIGHIAVGIGPGSYTGTRVGVAVAKSLAFALKIPLSSFCSLLAFLPEEKYERFACVMPSRTGEYFLLEGMCAEGGLQVVFSGLVSREILLQALEMSSAVLGKPVAELQEKLPEVPWLTLHPSFGSILRFLNGKTPCTEERVDVIYLHQP